jgi:hypothetical protein
MLEKSFVFVVLASSGLLLVQSASAAPVSRTALDRCVLRGGTIEPFSGGKSCCYTDNNGSRVCIQCPPEGVTCEQYGPPARGTKK